MGRRPLRREGRLRGVLQGWGYGAVGGTALSPGLPMMGAQALFTLLSTRGGRSGKAGAAGLTVLGAGGTIGVLAETITYRVLSPRTFDPAKALIVSAAIVLSPLMTILGAGRLRALRNGR